MRTRYEKPPPCAAICPRHQSRCTFDKDHGRSHHHYVNLKKDICLFELEDQESANPASAQGS